MTIPYTTFSTDGEFLHFAHANGYPPGAYTPFLEYFTPEYQVVASSFRPLWTDSTPGKFAAWDVLADDLLSFLEDAKINPRGTGKIIGIGHSLGATSTLIAALKRPEYFRALVLIEPIFFMPWMRMLWWLVTKLGAGYRVHPLIKGALKRRAHFPSREAMYENYRTKSVFHRISDQGLRAYVNALAHIEPDGTVTLAYPPAWEARIYATAGTSDPFVWKHAPRLNIPTLLIQGAETDAFGDSVAQRLLQHIPQAKLRAIPQTGHLAPLEKPKMVFEVIDDFLGRVR